MRRAGEGSDAMKLTALFQTAQNTGYVMKVCMIVIIIDVLALKTVILIMLFRSNLPMMVFNLKTISISYEKETEFLLSTHLGLTWLNTGYGNKYLIYLIPLD